MIASALRRPSFFTPLNHFSMARIGTFRINATTAPAMNGIRILIPVFNRPTIRPVSCNTKYRTMQPATPRKIFRKFFFGFDCVATNSAFLFYLFIKSEYLCIFIINMCIFNSVLVVFLSFCLQVTLNVSNFATPNFIAGYVMHFFINDKV